MPDLVWPIDIIPSRVRWGFVDSTARSDSPTTGVTRTSSLYGTRRWKATLEFDNLNAARRHRVLAFLAAAKQANRVWVPDLSTVRRGAMVAPELLTNADFSQGTTGWVGGGDFTVRNGVARIKLQAGGQQASVSASPGPTVIAHAPYAARMFVSALSDPAALSGPYLQDAGTIIYNTAYTAGTGMKTVAGVMATGGTGSFVAWSEVRASGTLAGQFSDVPFTSLARCVLADAGINLLPHSNDLTQSVWTKFQCSATYGDLAPDGSLTASRIIEDSTTNSHIAYDTQTVSANPADYGVSVAMLAGSRTWAFVNLSNFSTGDARCFVNLSTGAVGTVSVTGTGWANPRAVVRIMGDGWVQISLVARKTDSATTIGAAVGPALGDGIVTYAGNGTSFVYAWRNTFAPSSAFVRLVNTTGTAITTATQTGAAIHVKGGPANTNGALAAGDMVEIILPTYSHFARLTADLDFDAAGLGYMQFEPGLPTGVADNAAIIVEKPMCRMIPVDSFEWDTRPGLFSDFSVSFVQAT